MRDLCGPMQTYMLIEYRHVCVSVYVLVSRTNCENVKCLAKINRSLYQSETHWFRLQLAYLPDCTPAHSIALSLALALVNVTGRPICQHQCLLCCICVSHFLFATIRTATCIDICRCWRRLYVKTMNLSTSNAHGEQQRAHGLRFLNSAKVAVCVHPSLNVSLATRRPTEPNRTINRREDFD